MANLSFEWQSGSMPTMPYTPQLPLPEEQPLLGLLEAADAFQIGRSNAYLMAARGEFPVEVLRIGRQYRVRTRDVREFLGLD